MEKSKIELIKATKQVYRDKWITEWLEFLIPLLIFLFLFWIVIVLNVSGCSTPPITNCMPVSTNVNICNEDTDILTDIDLPDIDASIIDDLMDSGLWPDKEKEDSGMDSGTDGGKE